MNFNETDVFNLFNKTTPNMDDPDPDSRFLNVMAAVAIEYAKLKVAEERKECEDICRSLASCMTSISAFGANTCATIIKARDKN